MKEQQTKNCINIITGADQFRKISLYLEKKGTKISEFNSYKDHFGISLNGFADYSYKFHMRLKRGGNT